MTPSTCLVRPTVIPTKMLGRQATFSRLTNGCAEDAVSAFASCGHVVTSRKAAMGQGTKSLRDSPLTRGLIRGHGDGGENGLQFYAKDPEGYIGTAKGWNNETRAIGDAGIILTSRSKRFRLDGIEVLAVLKDRFVLCCLKDVERWIT